MASLRGPIVDAAWLTEHIDDDALVLVDVRWSLADGPDLEAYDRAHIPGAVFADLDVDLSAPPSPEAGRHPLPPPEEFAASMGALGIGDDTCVVIYDDAGGIIAARLWWMLDVIDRAAAVLDGGIQAWSGELSAAIPSVTPGSFTPVPWPTDRTISADSLASVLGSATVILDARSAERYAHGSPIDPRPGHVPGARSAPATDNLVEGRWREADQLRESYKSLGADGDDVVAYCGSGVTACADLLGRRLAGLPDARLYVGSWSQWGADLSRPIT
jgi:thiosulfate/3-mercaptopyruvate sulfurtransferase